MPTRGGAVLASLLLILAAGCGSGNETSVIQQDAALNVMIGGSPTVRGSGKTATEDRQLPAFHRVRASNGIEVVVAVTGTESATVEADHNLLPLIQTMVENGTLHITVTGSLSTRNPLRVRVAARQVDGLIADSGAKISSKDIPGDELTLSASSSGSVTVDHMDTMWVKVAASSSGSVTTAGRADRQEVDASSSGRYDGGKLVSRVSNVSSSSSGSATLNATEELSGSASSSGTVRYSGRPASVAVSTSSSGSVQAIGR